MGISVAITINFCSFSINLPTLNGCALRNGNIHNADDWKALLTPIIERYAKRDIMRFFRGDAALAIPELYESFEYQAASCKKPCCVIAKIEWHSCKLFRRLGFIVNNIPFAPKELFPLYNQRGTAEQHIQEDQNAITWIRLFCKRLCDNEVRPQLHALVAHEHSKPPHQNRRTYPCAITQDYLSTG